MQTTWGGLAARMWCPCSDSMVETDSFGGRSWADAGNQTEVIHAFGGGRWEGRQDHFDHAARILEPHMSEASFFCLGSSKLSKTQSKSTVPKGNRVNLPKALGSREVSALRQPTTAKQPIFIEPKAKQKCHPQPSVTSHWACASRPKSRIV